MRSFEESMRKVAQTQRTKEKNGEMKAEPPKIPGTISLPATD